MKFVLIVILFLIIGMLVDGFYIKSNGGTNGEFIIGISVLMTAFVLMPFFDRNV